MLTTCNVFHRKYRLIRNLLVIAGLLWLYSRGSKLNWSSAKVQKPKHNATLLHRRWNALKNLNGSLFRTETSSIHCTDPSIFPPNLINLRFRNYNFVGTQLFEFPPVIDLPAKICLFKQGYSVLPGAYSDRDFSFVHNPSHTCLTPRTDSVDLLLLVRSAHLQMGRRETIRKLWARESCWSPLTIRHVFLLGSDSNTRHMDRITEEAETRQDIVQQAFTDSYRNITYKFLLGLQWSIAYCPQAKWLLFIDDDFFVNPKSLSDLLHSLHPRLMHDLILGSQHTHSSVVRGRSKWGIDKKLYAHDLYPNFLSGGSQLIGSRLALELYVASRFTRYFPLDDVFTSFLLNKLGRTTTDSSRVMIVLPRRRYQLNSTSLATIHGMSRPAQQRLVWWKFAMKKLCRNVQ